MKRATLAVFSLIAAPAAWSCTMAFPAAGVYSGGAFVVQPSSTPSFFVLLTAAVLLKATVFASLATGRWWRLFGWMLVANLATTALGFFLEAVHMSWLGYYGGLTLLAFPVFYWAVRFLQPTGVLGPLARKRCWPSGVGLLVLFFFTGVFGVVPLQLSPTGAWHWIMKFLFATTALVVTLFVTTAYEFRILAPRVGLVGRQGMAPVLRANYVVFGALFLFATGVLLWRGTYPVP